MPNPYCLRNMMSPPTPMKKPLSDGNDWQNESPLPGAQVPNAFVGDDALSSPPLFALAWAEPNPRLISTPACPRANCAARSGTASRGKYRNIRLINSLLLGAACAAVHISADGTLVGRGDRQLWPYSPVKTWFL